VTVQLPEKGRILHIRITPPAAAKGLALQSVKLTGTGGKPENWDFSGP
jgi:hypothetical protein